MPHAKLSLELRMRLKPFCLGFPTFSLVLPRASFHNLQRQCQFMDHFCFIRPRTLATQYTKLFTESGTTILLYRMHMIRIYTLFIPQNLWLGEEPPHSQEPDAGSVDDLVHWNAVLTTISMAKTENTRQWAWKVQQLPSPPTAKKQIHPSNSPFLIG